MGGLLQRSPGPPRPLLAVTAHLSTAMYQLRIIACSTIIAVPNVTADPSTPASVPITALLMIVRSLPLWF